MARSKKRLHMLQEKREKQKARRREQLMRCESMRETSSIENNSLARLQRRRKSNRRLVREAIIRFIVTVTAFIFICYYVAKFIADKI